MKRIVLCLFLSSLIKTSSAQKAALVITNPLPIERQDELVVLSRADVEKKVGAAKHVSLSIKNRNIAAQHDDVDGDGKWDELVFLHSFKPKEIVSINIAAASNNVVSEAVQRAHVRLKKRNADDTWGAPITEEEMPVRNPATDFSKQPLPNYLTEGPAWENDKLAFRLYLDVRNNKDIYAKRVSRMVMDSVGTKNKPSYHDFNDWGMDVLHVVKSLGAGALALWVPLQNGTDTLMRLGGANVKRTRYKQLADGPVRALFQMTYDWEVEGKPVEITERISIWGGQYFYESKVWVNGAPAGTKLVSGIADFYGNVFQAFSEGNSSIIFSHGKQSENKDIMGMAIMVPKDKFAFAGTAPKANSEVLTTYYAAQHIQPNTPAIFRFYVGWEKTDSKFVQLSNFKNLLQLEAQKNSSPLIVKW